MKYLTLSSAIALSGCSPFSGLFNSDPEVPQVAPVEVVTITVPAPAYHPPLPEGVSPAEIEWVVLTPEIMREYIAELDAQSAPQMAYYGLTSQAYENLANNLADIRRYIRQTLNVIQYYRENDPTRDEVEE